MTRARCRLRPLAWPAIAGSVGLLVGCAASEAPRAPTASASSPAGEERCPAPWHSPETLAARLFEQVNVHRAQQAMPALAPREALVALAQAHSDAMTRHGLSHDGVAERSQAVASGGGSRGGTSRFAENVARVCGDATSAADEVMRRWLASPQHREHLEGDFTETGIAAARSAAGWSYITQIFYSPGS